MTSRRRRTVLLAEDDPVMRGMYALRLRLDGYDVLEAGDGLEALFLAARSPGLAVLDVRMPAISGLDVLRILKADPATAGLPVVMFSNETSPDTIASALTAGAVGWWTKSRVAPAELSRRVGELLAGDHSRPEEMVQGRR